MKVYLLVFLHFMRLINARNLEHIGMVSFVFHVG